uniref:CesA5A-like n=1 Tax=Rhizophora mucronata TaxID=61149 RepID=A0A2P2IT38_RHIMU
MAAFLNLPLQIPSSKKLSMSLAVDTRIRQTGEVK